MVHADTEQAMKQLRATWGDRWYIWRTGGTWAGTLTDDAAGIDATVIADSAGRLDAALAHQAAMAEAVRRLVEAVRAEGVMWAEPDGNLVRVWHYVTGRCDTVALLHATGLSWAWLHDTIEPIGRADELVEVVAKIQARLGTPYR